MRLSMLWSTSKPAPDGAPFKLMLWRDPDGDDASDPDHSELHTDLADADRSARAQVPGQYAYGHIFAWDPAEGDYGIEHGAYGYGEPAAS